jgi:hypothetical protein
MTTRTNKHSRTGITTFVALTLLISLSLLGPGCSPDMGDDPIPIVPFEPIVANLSLPEFAALRTDRSFVYSKGGVRGIVLYRQDATTYVAFERNCSYHPNEACSTVEVHSSTLYMIDPCCNSIFSFATGEPNSGPAWRPLLRYRTILNGTQLTITDEIL